MTQLVAATLQRLFARQSQGATRSVRTAQASRDVRSHRPDFAETRPVVFRSEAFAEDLVLSHGVA